MEFSLEKISERIHFGKTKGYFKEVLSSYQNGNYRSSIVMLWSVAVCDIIYKLQYLVDLYEDAAARDILNELTALQNSDPKSSGWEVKLVDDVYDKTNLVDGSEYENLRYLQKQRHLCAHPVLNQDRELHTPNKETVRSLLRNTLEGVLIKPPFYTQRIFDELMVDISENSEALNSRKKVKQYVESRYLSRLTISTELQIYRSLWKIVFKLENDECERNRKINLQLLEVIGSRNKTELSSLISGDLDYFSNISSSGWPIKYLVFYLSKNHHIYALLSDDAKLKIQHCIATEDIGKSLGWFVKENLEQHFEDLIEWVEGDEHPTIDSKHWDAILEINDSAEWEEMFCKTLSAYYTASRGFTQADGRFRRAILPYIHLFSIDAILYLLSKIEDNNQVYGRNRASVDHPKVMSHALELDKQFDVSPYPNFADNVREDEDEDEQEA